MVHGSCPFEGLGGGGSVFTQDKAPDTPPKMLLPPLSSGKIVILSSFSFENSNFDFFMFS
jgi:hypothetical protein